MNIEDHLITKGSLLKDALSKLNKIIGEKILFIVDNDMTFLGSVTDGDIRRGLISNGSLDQRIESFQQLNPKFFYENNIDLDQLIILRQNGYKVIPLVDEKKKIKYLIDFNKIKSYLPLDTVIMAGGKGKRLLPFTKKTPKPLLKVAGRPIIEHGFDFLKLYGIKNFWVSINYLKDDIKNFFSSGYEDLNIKFIEERKPLGTIGSLSMIENLNHKHLLITNSDLLTNLDYEDFYLDFIKNDADISLVTIPYKVQIPYGIIKNDENKVKKISEKPTYTYYSNAGIYLIKREVIDTIPKKTFYNATDLITKVISNNKKVISYPFSGYWLDIGKPDDYRRAQIDITNIKFH